MPFVELHAIGALSFLRGASMPEQMVERAAELKMPALALLDRDGVYGAPRLAAAAKEQGIKPIFGAELTMDDGAILPLLVENRAGWKHLCELITRSRLRGTKEQSEVRWEELPEFARGLVAIANCGSRIAELKTVFGRENVFLEVHRHHIRGEERAVAETVALSQKHDLPLLATNLPQYATPPGRQVLDVFTCIRHHTHLDAAGRLLSANSERHLKSDAAMRALFHDLPDALENTQRLADRLTFSLDDMGYEFPRYDVPEGETMPSFLHKVTWAGARARYSHLSAKVHAQIERELALIERLGFAGYFLIVWDIANFCSARNIMMQGRGSAANSAVCYSLGITAVDPVGAQLLFERFLSEGRKSWPDIDLDLPSGERREAVIQEVYRRYGPHGAAMTANVITFRGRSAAREIGKALNLPGDVLDRFSSLFAHGDFPHTLELQAQMEQAGLSALHPRAPAFLKLYAQMHGLPRHLGQHSGGMIICQGQLSSIVPLENASMPGRVVAQWDKDDCDQLGIIKVDLLGLGMMSVMQDTIELCAERGHPVDLATIPKDDPATYDLMCAADTIGVFQIESRAQMATLPRMQPRCFYDVVIEVAIIRPGPIQGHLMHPYLARRAGREPVTYYDESVRPVLERTLGIPLFQEQMLKIAMVMAGFTGAEAEELRRALSYHRSQERMQRVEKKLREAMAARGVGETVIEQIVAAISSFALYGFPESHAISFALIAYASAWLKVHRPAEFYASLLNNQPMGFYSSATLVKDAQRHGLRFLPVDVNTSDWRCTLEEIPIENRTSKIENSPVRLGLCVVNGLRREHALDLISQRPFTSLADLKKRTSLNKDELRTLAELGALNSFAAHRRDALWQIEEPARDEDFPTARLAETPLAPMTPIERSRADYTATSLTTGPHPMALLRDRLPDIWTAAELAQARHGDIVRIAGNVICRQRPGTAKGFCFISLEDETGVANAIVRPDLFERLRLVITHEPFLQIEGRVQIAEGTTHIQARSITPLAADQLPGTDSYDFH